MARSVVRKRTYMHDAAIVQKGPAVSPRLGRSFFFFIFVGGKEEQVTGSGGGGSDNGVESAICGWALRKIAGEDYLRVKR